MSPKISDDDYVVFYENKSLSGVFACPKCGESFIITQVEGAEFSANKSKVRSVRKKRPKRSKSHKKQGGRRRR